MGGKGVKCIASARMTNSLEVTIRVDTLRASPTQAIMMVAPAKKRAST